MIDPCQFLRQGGVTFARLEPEIAATVDGRPVLVTALHLWLRLVGANAHGKDQHAAQLVGQALGWRLVARRAAREGFDLYGTEALALRRRRAAILARYVALTEMEPPINRAAAPVPGEEAAWAGAARRGETAALAEVVQMLEERATFQAYLRDKHIGLEGAGCIGPEDLAEIGAKELERAYEQQWDRTPQPTRLAVRRILTDGYERAVELMGCARDMDSFADLARRQSLGPEAADGGALGIVDLNGEPSLDPWVRHLLFNHARKHPDQPFFGPLRIGREGPWQVFAVQVVEERPASLADVAEILRYRLARDRIRKRGMRFLAELLAEFAVVLNRRWIEPEVAGH